MSVSTFQKLTIVSCVLLCVALLLPKMLLSRGKRDAPQTEGPAGNFPPMPHRAHVSDEQHRSGQQFSRAHNTEAMARAKGAGTGAGTGGKSNLAGQVIPIYGFGIFLYILYILFKITSRGKTTKPPESRFSAVRSQNMKRKITDFELAQLQDRLNETKDVIETIISSASVCSHSVGAVSGHEEQRLLHQLKEITRVMQEGHLMDEMPPNTEDQSCAHDWKDFAEDGENDVNQHFCGVHSPDMSSNTEMREACERETCVDKTEEEPITELNDKKTDANRSIDDLSPSDSMKHQCQTGSDTTLRSVSENTTIRQRNKKSVK
ncbi:protein RIC-3b isoform X1 [Paramisgurnus dabryanus]|uniref:protein RIC-3b isoform X1 n=1 Tax=Paramisgurnus dabryanus TaxID=90735 RepID=UPI0031F3EF3B